MTTDTRLWKWMATLLVAILGFLYFWLMPAPEPIVYTRATETPTRLPVTVLATTYQFLPPSSTPTLTPYAPFEFIERSPMPTSTPTPAPTGTATPEPPTATPVRTPVMRG